MMNCSTSDRILVHVLFQHCLVLKHTLQLFFQGVLMTYYQLLIAIASHVRMQLYASFEIGKRFVEFAIVTSQHKSAKQNVFGLHFNDSIFLKCYFEFLGCFAEMSLNCAINGTCLTTMA